MSEHPTESETDTEVSAYCRKCKRLTAHHVDHVAVGKPGPCLEHVSPWVSQDEINRHEYLAEQSRQRKLFGDHP